MREASTRFIGLSVSVPVRKGSEIPYALVMSLEPDRLVDILAGESLPPGWQSAQSPEGWR